MGSETHETSIFQSGRRELNPHGELSPTDFKSSDETLKGLAASAVAFTQNSAHATGAVAHGSIRGKRVGWSMILTLRRLLRLLISPVCRHDWVVAGTYLTRGGACWTQLRCSACQDHAAYPTIDRDRFLEIYRRRGCRGKAVPA